MLIQRDDSFNYKYLFISFMVIKYAWEQYINFRQLLKNLIREKPAELTSFNISDSRFLLSQSYSFDKLAFEMLALSIKAAIGCLSMACNVLPFIWDHVDCIFPFIDMQNEFERAVGFVLIEGFKYKAFQVPISVYQTFVIEKKYNFTNKTFLSFVYDLFVEAALTLIIFPSIIYGYMKVVDIGGEYFFVFLQVFAVAVTIILTWIHPNLISPIFNRFIQLKNSPLKMRIYTLAHQKKIRLKNILVMYSNNRQNHLNAYFYGLGESKTIVIDETLLKNLTNDQILGVIAHEIGHIYYWHSFQKLFVYLIEVITIFNIFALFSENQTVFRSFGFQEKSAFIGAALFFQLFQPLTDTFSTILLVVTRKFEFEADSFACSLGYGNQLKQGLTKIFQDSTSKVRPDKLYAWIKHSHPSIYERIDNIEEKIYHIHKKEEEEHLNAPERSESESFSDSSFSGDFSDSGLSF